MFSDFTKCVTQLRELAGIRLKETDNGFLFGYKYSVRLMTSLFNSSFGFTKLKIGEAKLAGVKGVKKELSPVLDGLRS